MMVIGVMMRIKVMMMKKKENDDDYAGLSSG